MKFPLLASSRESCYREEGLRPKRAHLFPPLRGLLVKCSSPESSSQSCIARCFLLDFSRSSLRPFLLLRGAAAAEGGDFFPRCCSSGLLVTLTATSAARERLPALPRLALAASCWRRRWRRHSSAPHRHSAQARAPPAANKK